jgi:hypothetical protein
MQTLKKGIEEALDEARQRSISETFVPEPDVPAQKTKDSYNCGVLCLLHIEKKFNRPNLVEDLNDPSSLSRIRRRYITKIIKKLKKDLPKSIYKVEVKQILLKLPRYHLVLMFPKRLPYLKMMM